MISAFAHALSITCMLSSVLATQAQASMATHASMKSMPSRLPTKRVKRSLLSQIVSCSLGWQPTGHACHWGLCFGCNRSNTNWISQICLQAGDLGQRQVEYGWQACPPVELDCKLFPSCLPSSPPPLQPPPLVDSCGLTGNHNLVSSQD